MGRDMSKSQRQASPHRAEGPQGRKARRRLPDLGDTETYCKERAIILWVRDVNKTARLTPTNEGEARYGCCCSPQQPGETAPCPDGDVLKTPQGDPPSFRHAGPGSALLRCRKGHGLVLGGGSQE